MDKHNLFTWAAANAQRVERSFARLERDLAVESHKCRLATLKHEKELAGCAVGEWAALLCAGRYVEAIFLQSPALADIDRVRISGQDMQEYKRLAFRAMRTGLDDAQERGRSGRYMAIRKRLREQNILLEGV
ncbi:MAG: hypothetical protein H7836_08450 [Magnetococcus sp. YQC-3]